MACVEPIHAVDVTAILHIQALANLQSPTAYTVWVQALRDKGVKGELPNTQSISHILTQSKLLLDC